MFGHYYILRCVRHFECLDEISHHQRSTGFAMSRVQLHHGDAPATADALRHRLEITVQRGWLLPADAHAIEAAARYCGAHHWNPTHPHLLRVVDGLADRDRRGDKAAWIEAFGDAWVPLQAAAAWQALGGPMPASPVQHHGRRDGAAVEGRSLT